MPEVIFQGNSIRYDDQGKGDRALLFLPGWCGSRKVFEPLLERCSKQTRVLSVDWRGHGESGAANGDFGASGLVEDAMAVVEASQANEVVPVALSHAGWVALELRRQMGNRIPKIVLLDWILLDPPPPFLGALQALQDPTQWQSTREQLFSMWLHGLNIPALSEYVRQDMGSFGEEMWGRAGREIGSAYEKLGSPFGQLAALEPQVPVLHLYAQPDDPGYLAAQQDLSSTHPWFHVQKLQAKSHFPMFEVPDDMSAAITTFAM